MLLDIVGAGDGVEVVVVHVHFVEAEGVGCCEAVGEGVRCWRAPRVVTCERDPKRGKERESTALSAGFLLTAESDGRTARAQVTGDT